MTQAQIFDLILVILPFILATVVVPLVKYLIGKLPASQQSKAMQIAMTAVQAVEQLAAKQTATISSAEKKAMAFSFVQQLLSMAHINVSEEVVSTLIESAVYLLNQTKDSTLIVKPATPPQQQVMPA